MSDNFNHAPRLNVIKIFSADRQIFFIDGGKALL